MKNSFCISILLLILVNCMNYDNVLSVNKYRLNDEVEKISLSQKVGYDCEINGMMSKQIVLNLKHEVINIKEFGKMKIRIGWREYMYFDKFDEEIKLKLLVCKKDQQSFILGIDLIDHVNKFVYVWSSKDPINLNSIDTLNLTLMSSGVIEFR